MTRRNRLASLIGPAVIGATLLARPAQAQVSVGAEAGRDRTAWHFDNPSSIDTSELVPHFFEQTYTLDNIWITGAATYRAGFDWRTSIGLTPVTQAVATDYDTFLDPGGVTWVAGTTGDARMHSLRFAQEVELGAAGVVSFSGGYRLRIDLADFLAGDRTVTRNGELVSRTTVTSREYTNAQTHEVFVGARVTRPLSERWRLQLAGTAAPAAINRLAIELPDKYPGQTLVFRTTNLLMAGRLAIVYGQGRWPLVLGVQGERSWNYSDTQWVRRSAVGAAVGLGTTW